MMLGNWTPLLIKMLLHYYSVDEPYAQDNTAHRESMAVKEGTQALIDRGYIVISNAGSGYDVTDKALCIINYWLSASDPEWRMP